MCSIREPTERLDSALIVLYRTVRRIGSEGCVSVRVTIVVVQVRVHDLVAVPFDEARYMPPSDVEVPQIERHTCVGQVRINDSVTFHEREETLHIGATYEVEVLESHDHSFLSSVGRDLAHGPVGDVQTAPVGDTERLLPFRIAELVTGMNDNSPCPEFARQIYGVMYLAQTFVDQRLVLRRQVVPHGGVYAAHFNALLIELFLVLVEVVADLVNVNGRELEAQIKAFSFVELAHCPGRFLKGLVDGSR